jgi:hypothetical protein
MEGMSMTKHDSKQQGQDADLMSEADLDSEQMEALRRDLADDNEAPED